jgi:hypothetical protein
MLLTDVISKIFYVFPTAKLVGKYIIYHNQQRMESLDQIDLIISDHRPVYKIQQFQNLLSSHLIKIEKINEFDGLTPTQHRFTLQNINEKEKFEISISVDYDTQSYLTIGSIAINSSYNIVQRSNHYYHHIQECINDINNRIIRLNIPLNSIVNTVERKYSYLRMINLMCDLIEHDGNNYWIFNSNHESDILNIFQHVDPMDIEEFHNHNGENRENGDEDSEGNNIDLVCPICRDNFTTGDICIFLKCQHKFHTDCIIGNLSELGPNSDTCPICRHQII